MEFIEPLKQGKKLKEYLDTGKYKRVAIFWGHGLGDSIQFRIILEKLKELYPKIEFKMAIFKGLDLEVVFPEHVFVNSREEAMNLKDFDLVCQINFPLEREGLTKTELCCQTEIGIEPINGHLPLPEFHSPLVAVHFNLTSLPELVRPSRETAESIWNEIREAGLIPIEVHFSHVFDNPVNKKFDFVDCTVRNCKAHLSSLFGLLKISRFFVGVVSGPFHSAMAILPHERICYLQKDIPLERFTHENIKVIDIKNYKKNSVLNWLREQIARGL